MDMTGCGIKDQRQAGRRVSLYTYAEPHSRWELLSMVMRAAFLEHLRSIAISSEIHQ
jgi:hypothetical protein